MVNRRKAFSLISSRDHCQRSSPSRISDTPRAGFEPAQNLSSGFVEWSCAVVITTTPRRHRCHHNPKKSTFLLFYLMFTVSFTPYINRPDVSSYSTILITSSISSFEMNKANLYLLSRLLVYPFFFQICLIQTNFL